MDTHTHDPANPPSDAPDTEIAQPALPFLDDEPGDEIVPFRLTARARRVIAPASLPDLAVIEGPTGRLVPLEDDPGDTRPARARALRRAGLSTTAIAADLGADELLVRAWCGDVAAPRRRPGTATDPVAGTSSPDDGHDQEEDLARERFARLRDHIREQLTASLPDVRAAVAGAAGVVAALAEVTPRTVTATLANERVAGLVVGWLVTHAGADPDRIRIVLRHGHDVAADREVHAWAEATHLQTTAIRPAPWRDVADVDAVQGLLRVPDGDVAARVAAWQEVLLSVAAAPADAPGVGVRF